MKEDWEQKFLESLPPSTVAKWFQNTADSLNQRPEYDGPLTEEDYNNLPPWLKVFYAQ